MESGIAAGHDCEEQSSTRETVYHRGAEYRTTVSAPKYASWLTEPEASLVSRGCIGSHRIGHLHNPRSEVAAAGRGRSERDDCPIGRNSQSQTRGGSSVTTESSSVGRSTRAP